MWAGADQILDIHHEHDAHNHRHTTHNYYEGEYPWQRFLLLHHLLASFKRRIRCIFYGGHPVESTTVQVLLLPVRGGACRRLSEVPKVLHERFLC